VSRDREAAAALKARKAALKAQQAERLAAAREDMARKREAIARRGGPMGEREAARKKRRRRRLLLAALVLLLLLLFRDCRCSSPEPGAEAPAPGAGPAAEVEDSPPTAPLPGGHVARQDRPEYASATPEALPWIGAFRMQVAARGPRLAECFVGADRPGALKWTASVEPTQGRVSDHLLEPTLMSDGLTREQQSCAADVLSEPTYTLDADGERATPARVSMVIEF